MKGNKLNVTVIAVLILSSLIFLAGCVEQQILPNNTKDNQSLVMVSSSEVKYDPEILKVFEIKNEVRVIAEVKDESNVQSPEEKNEWFKSRINEITDALPSGQFKDFNKGSITFAVTLTKEGLDTLNEDSRIKAIYPDFIVKV